MKKPFLMLTAITAVITLTFVSCIKKGGYVCHCVAVTPGTTDTVDETTNTYEDRSKGQAQKACDDVKEEFQSLNSAGVTCTFN